MMRVLQGVCALLVAHVVADHKDFLAQPGKIADQTFLQRQIDLYKLYTHVTEPLYDKELKTIADTWDLEKNIQKFENVTALKVFFDLKEYNMLLPRSVPFNILEPRHQWEAVTLFNVLYSAKDYTTFYKTAVYFRELINEGLFIYVLSVAILHYPETQGIIIPPIYEVFPSYFHNAEIMNIAQRINSHGKRYVKQYPQTYLWEDNVVIKWNTTIWPYVENYAPVSYYLNDYALNALYYNYHLTYPFWMSGKQGPLSKFKRGEMLYFASKQFVTRYYLERLSNGLDEISDINLKFVVEGYSSGLVHYNGVPFPDRPNFFYLYQPKLIKYVEKVKLLERRIRDAIEIGYFVNQKGEKIDLRTPEAIDVLGKAIEGNVDSPNIYYYGSVITAWKNLLGNSAATKYNYWHDQVPLVRPSALELYQTTLRDPAFYMIWKRVLDLITLWQSYLPVYKPEELAFSTLKIQKVEVDKLVTYFEHTYLNVTSALPMNEFESKVKADEFSVLVQRPQLNHKKFKVRVYVKSEVPKTVVVKFFLAPKYDSKGFEIPLHENTQNFFQFDQFVYELPQGETVIQRDSDADKVFKVDKWTSGYDIYRKAYNALHGNGQFVIDNNNFFDGFPRRLLIPKGRVGGMPFQFLVYIHEFHAPATPYGTGVNPENTYGIGTGANRMTSYPLRFPLDRPLHEWQIKRLTNFWLQEVQITHKTTPDIIVPNSMFA
ncbi:acidic juvenile hormone-suppressible protein 1-like [Bicyclus anynana]|uniref:Acidic juvenile hormone-suppressible protein 1-like n=1 Tax=Bicyclus anynana TaxID=110368 RepID=A0A6J1MN43_BICAN|nr:acidic juvenile hormone-suppressible protein 1-like [Bicyclus anynana]